MLSVWPQPGAELAVSQYYSRAMVSCGAGYPIACGRASACPSFPGQACRRMHAPAGASRQFHGDSERAAGVWVFACCLAHAGPTWSEAGSMRECVCVPACLLVRLPGSCCRRHTATRRCHGASSLGWRRGTRCRREGCGLCTPRTLMQSPQAGGMLLVPLAFGCAWGLPAWRVAPQPGSL